MNASKPATRECCTLRVDHNGVERFSVLYDGDQGGLMSFLSHFLWPPSLGVSLSLTDAPEDFCPTPHVLAVTQSGSWVVFETTILTTPQEAKKLAEGLNANAVVASAKWYVDIRELVASDATSENPIIKCGWGKLVGGEGNVG